MQRSLHLTTVRYIIKVALRSKALLTSKARTAPMTTLLRLSALGLYSLLMAHVLTSNNITPSGTSNRKSRHVVQHARPWTPQRHWTVQQQSSRSASLLTSGR